MSETFQLRNWWQVTVAGITHWAANCEIDPPETLASLAARLRGQSVVIDGNAYRVRDVGGNANGGALREADIMVHEREIATPK